MQTKLLLIICGAEPNQFQYAKSTGKDFKEMGTKQKKEEKKLSAIL